MRFAAAICAIVWLAAAADYPKPTGYVNDFAGQLSPEFQRNLESRLRQYERAREDYQKVVDACAAPAAKNQPAAGLDDVSRMASWRLQQLAWMEKLAARARIGLAAEEIFIFAGDFNVIPTDLDARFPAHWVNAALYQPEVKAAFRRLLYLGLIDAFRACDGNGGNYTFWDYQAGSWQKDDGIRIDFALLSPQAADRLVSATIDKRPRGWAKPSDHVPVIVELDL